MMPPPTMSTRLLTVPPRLRPHWPIRPLRCPQRGRNSRLGSALRRSSRLSDPPAERIGVIEDERRFRGHVRASGDVGQDVAALGFVGRKRRFEHGADDALLPPELTGV